MAEADDGDVAGWLIWLWLRLNDDHQPVRLISLKSAGPVPQSLPGGKKILDAFNREVNRIDLDGEAKTREVLNDVTVRHFDAAAQRRR